MEINSLIELLKRNESYFQSLLTLQQIFTEKRIGRGLMERINKRLDDRFHFDKYDGLVVDLKDRHYVYIYGWADDKARYLLRFTDDGWHTIDWLPENLKAELKLRGEVDPSFASSEAYYYKFSEEEKLVDFLKELISRN